MQRICLRIDDIGASTKQYEVYSKSRIGNLLFLKYIHPFRAWGPYDEMDDSQWQRVLDLLIKYSAKLTVGITATWVERDGELAPFPEKFPAQARVIKQGWKEGLLEIANHGLTHCVVGKHLPRLFSSNRKYHREFWEWVPREIHFEHLEKSQAIFQEWLGERPTTLIPPGNVYTVDTLEAAKKHGIERINSYIDHGVESSVRIINNDQIDAFHDREIVLEGMVWLERKLNSYNPDTDYTFIRNV